MSQKVSLSHIKIPAFTMIDMITGMVIMSIIISVVFYVFSGFNQQIQSYSHSKSAILALNLLKIELDNQIANSNLVMEKPNGFVVVSRVSKIAYELAGTTLVRKTKFKEEVIYDSAKNLDLMTFVNQNLRTENEIVSGISLEVFVGKKDLSLHLYKEYSNQEQINFSILNEVR